MLRGSPSAVPACTACTCATIAVASCTPQSAGTGGAEASASPVRDYSGDGSSGNSGGKVGRRPPRRRPSPPPSGGSSSARRGRASSACRGRASSACRGRAARPPPCRARSASTPAIVGSLRADARNTPRPRRADSPLNKDGGVAVPGTAAISSSSSSPKMSPSGPSCRDGGSRVARRADAATCSSTALRLARSRSAASRMP